MASLPASSSAATPGSATATSAVLKRPRRIRYDSSTTEPQQSPHWESLTHRPDDELLCSLQDVQAAFRTSICSSSEDNAILASLWSVVCGYCEALTTHKDETRRYSLYPIPIDALRRLVNDEFVPFCQQLKETYCSASKPNNKSPQQRHRETVRQVSNAVWKKAQSKSKNVRDELHANSLYVCFRGNIDKRSLDCFGAAIVTIAALQHVLKDGDSTSYLTLSEDHAYESHIIKNGNEDNGDGQQSSLTGTCEMAIPGNTKDIQQTRGLDIAEAIQKANKGKNLPYEVTPDNSWLYMKSNAVVCRTTPMVLGASIGNVNCSIQAPKGNNGNNYFISGPLMDLKRELLWILHDDHHIDTFPFALMELGECEEHRSTPRGLEWVDAGDHWGIQDQVMAVEKLYLDAMATSQTMYGDSQSYPYFCAGHYHKDAVWEEDDDAKSVHSSDSSDQCRFNPEREYRLVEAIRLYSQASRVASKYRYDLQLMKHTTKGSKLILDDILTQNGQPREWCQENNAVATATWLLAFVDSLLLWEEECGGKQFCEMLTPNHPHGIGKLFQYLGFEVRKEALKRIHAAHDQSSSAAKAITENNLLYFSQPRSKRLQPGSPLVAAFGKEKVVVKEMELTIPMSDSDGRRAKRSRRS